MSFQVEIRAVGETLFCENSLVFETKREAIHYGADLYTRWTGMEEWKVVETTKPVNYVWDFEKNTYCPI